MKVNKKEDNIFLDKWGSGEMVDTVDSKSTAIKSVWVRIPSPLPVFAKNILILLDILE